jgi:Uma2 family endonuclease
VSSVLEKFADKEYYTYADYLEWDEDARAEIINGNIYMMSPPLTIHQRISMRLSQRIARFLEGKTCEVFAAPFGVRLFPLEDKTDDTVVEPDIVVVCDPSKIDERGCNGAPDLIIDILSPSNQRRERFLKFDLYLKAKVREYWVVYPENKEIEVHLFDDGRYFMQAYGVNEPDTKEEDMAREIVPVSVLPGLEINAKDIFK